MAYWVRKNDKYVFVSYYESGKLISLPRAQTKHLDGAPDTNIDAWVRNWELVNGIEKIETNLLHHTPTVKLVERYATYLESRKKAPGTVVWHKQMLKQYVLPFFVHQQPILHDPGQWPGKSIQLLDYLVSQEASEATIVRSNIALRSFWKWLMDEGMVINHLMLRLRNPVIADKPTPLKVTLKPKEVLKFIKDCHDAQIKMAAVLGYFFSLRPQELFGLRKSDFRAGSKVGELECCKVMKRYKLYSSLAVHIERQRTQRGAVTAPKAYSVGWVACFDKAGAEAIAQILNGIEIDREGLLFGGHTNDTWFDKWNKLGIPNITLKDLRRASLYHLGHHHKFDLIPLKNHARHKDVNTTMEYLRRPEEELEEGNDILDLEA